MRILDLLRMSSANLWKRKVRTLLTILGVVIGTASIVVMVSLGLGLNKATMEDIEQYGGLTTIEVREGRGDSSSYTTYSIGGGGSVFGGRPPVFRRGFDASGQARTAFDELSRPLYRKTRRNGLP